MHGLLVNETTAYFLIISFIVNIVLFLFLTDKNMRKFSTKLVMGISIISCIFMVILLEIDHFGIYPPFEDKLRVISNNLVVMGFWMLTEHAPNFLVTSFFLYHGFIVYGTLFIRITNLLLFTLFQVIIFKVSYHTINKNESRATFKIGTTMLVSNFVLFYNVLFIENFNLIGACFFYAGILCLKEGKDSLAGIMFGFLAGFHIDFLFLFIALCICMPKKNAGGVQISRFFLSASIVIFLSYIIPSLNKITYFIGFVSYNILPTFPFDLNLFGVITKVIQEEFGFGITLLPAYVALFTFAGIRRKGNHSRKIESIILDVMIIVFIVKIDYEIADFIYLLPLFSLAVHDGRKLVMYMYTVLSGFIFLQEMLIFSLGLDVGSDTFTNDSLAIGWMVVLLKVVITDLLLVRMLNLNCTRYGNQTTLSRQIAIPQLLRS
ncbi:MAG: hypothetical protein ACTSUE_01540 [Promethearchaeota archaeon]